VEPLRRLLAVRDVDPVPHDEEVSRPLARADPREERGRGRIREVEDLDAAVAVADVGARPDDLDPLRVARRVVAADEHQVRGIRDVPDL
jgi:hypothetical protein